MTSKRPSGLVVLAILNFVFAVPSLWAAVAIYEFETTDLRRGTPTPLVDASAASLLLLATALVIAGLLITSGIGYLKQHRLLGRAVGNAFAVVSIATALVVVSITHGLVGSIALLCMLYPIATAALINGPLRTALVR